MTESQDHSRNGVDINTPHHQFIRGDATFGSTTTTFSRSIKRVAIAQGVQYLEVRPLLSLGKDKNISKTVIADVKDAYATSVVF